MDTNEHEFIKPLPPDVPFNRDCPARLEFPIADHAAVVRQLPDDPGLGVASSSRGREGTIPC